MIGAGAGRTGAGAVVRDARRVATSAAGEATAAALDTAGSCAPKTIAVTAGRESPATTRQETETRVISRFTRHSATGTDWPRGPGCSAQASLGGHVEVAKPLAS